MTGTVTAPTDTDTDTDPAGRPPARGRYV